MRGGNILLAADNIRFIAGDISCVASRPRVAVTTWQNISRGLRRKKAHLGPEVIYSYAFRIPNSGLFR